MTENNNLIDPTVIFHDGDDGGLVVQHTQEIPDEFLDSLKEARKESTQKKMGDWHRVASIPTAVYEAWLRDGFDAQKEPAAKTLARLKAQSLDYFITTDRRIA